MVGTLCVAVLAMAGIDVGWESNAQGELEYIIQIDPETLKNLANSPGSQVLYSDIRPDLMPFRTYRIQIGTGKVPRIPENPPEHAETMAKKPKDEPSESRGSPSDGTAATAATAPEGVGDRAGGSPEDKTRDVTMMVTSGTAIGLLAALLYLAWIHLDTRSRYRALLLERITLDEGRRG